MFGQALPLEKLDSSSVRELEPKIRQSKERLESSSRSPYPEFPFPIPRSVMFSLPRCSVLDTPSLAPRSAPTVPFSLPRAFCSRFPELVASNGSESPLHEPSVLSPERSGLLTIEQMRAVGRQCVPDTPIPASCWRFHTSKGLSGLGQCCYRVARPERIRGLGRPLRRGGARTRSSDTRGIGNG